jgi:hypothetical protein
MPENVQQLTGGTVKGLEHCPPLYHFDLSADEFEELTRNPGPTLDRLGLNFLPKPTYITLLKPDQEWSETEGWQQRMAAVDIPGGVCCHSWADGGVQCFGHRIPVVQ